MKFKRAIQPLIEKSLLKNKVIIIYGARQVGKTTLCKQLLDNISEQTKYVNCEEEINRSSLESKNPTALKEVLGNNKVVVLDEAQRIKDIGLVLKILIDTYPETQIIATGSSSFDLANKLNEPLTGRAREFLLYPLSIHEIYASNLLDKSEIKSKLPSILKYGLYPGVFNQNADEAVEELRDIAGKYLFKDILMHQDLRRSDLVTNLLKSLAYQLGNEVSYNELGKLLGENHVTVKNYIEILEKCFVIFRIPALSRNPRVELSKSRKIYFYDLGVRNFLINNFNDVNPIQRNDVGGMWENFCILEMIKKNEGQRIFPNYYFWRNYNQNEIDFIQESGGILNSFEFKWNPNATIKTPKAYLEAYPDSTYKVVNTDNWLEYLDL
jgi:predicted AAA+ superfamily ATPase